MADQKITQLTEDTAPAPTDLVATVEDPGGTAVTKKVTISNLNKVLLAAANVFTAAQKINVNSSTALLVEQDGVLDNVFVVDTASGGRVSINGAPYSASSTLTLYSSANVGASLFMRSAGGGVATRGCSLVAQRSNGTHAAMTAVVLDDTLISFGAEGYDGVAFTGTSTAAIQFTADENFVNSPTAKGTRIQFLTTSNGAASRSERMRITNNGIVGIGTSAPTARLHVVGTTDIVQFIVKGNSTQNVALQEWQKSDATVYLSVTGAGHLSFVDATNILIGTSTGTKIGASDTAKIAMYNATPVVRQNHIVDATNATDVITRCNAILAALETFGILKTA